MKHLVLFISLSLFNISFAQSKHGYQTGLDTVALNHRIKKMTIYKISVYHKIDTTFLDVYSYMENGFLAKFESYDLHHFDRDQYFQNGYTSCTFTYNDNGYLIDEYYKVSGPINGSFTGSWQQTVKEETYENGILRTVVETSETEYEYDSTTRYKSTSTSLYDEHGKLLECNFGSINVKYIYDENGLLMEIVSSGENDVFNRSVYNYEFY